MELPTGIAIPTEDVVELRLVGGSGLQMKTRRGSRFDLKTIRPVCAEKYLTALAMLKELRESAAGEEAEPAPADESEEASENAEPESTETKESTEEAEE